MSLDADEKRIRECFGYDTVWHLVGAFDTHDHVSYKEYWSGDEKAIEATVALWKREGAFKIIQSEYLKKNGKLRYMVACGKDHDSEG